MNKNNEILVEIIKRFYGCRIIQGKKLGSGFTSQHAQTEFEPHTNILPALCAVSFYLLFRRLKFFFSWSD